MHRLVSAPQSLEHFCRETRGQTGDGFVPGDSTILNEFRVDLESGRIAYALLSKIADDMLAEDEDRKQLRVPRKN